MNFENNILVLMEIRARQLQIDVQNIYSSAIELEDFPDSRERLILLSRECQRVQFQLHDNLLTWADMGSCKYLK